MTTKNAQIRLPLDLGDGLTLRAGRAADTGELEEFDARIHGDSGPDLRVGVAVRNLMQGRLITCGPQDFTVVTNEQGKIISSLVLLSQTWSYAGIQFPAGQPEFVGTDPQYRNRGLIRKQFDVIHAWSRERGQIMQGITGIPYYYRLFDYEMTVDLDGWRGGYAANVPPLAENEQEPYVLRPAFGDDIPFIHECYTYGQRNLLLTNVRSEAEWRYEILEKEEEHVTYRMFFIITTPEGEQLGFFSIARHLDANMVLCHFIELKPGVSWLAVAPTVIRALWRAGQDIAARTGERCDLFTFVQPEGHPIYTAAAANLPRRRDPYAWYIRVPDLKGFLGLITPVLEQRLENSVCAGHTGELTLGFYSSGLRLRFERGKLLEIADWQHDTSHWPMAAFGRLSFLQVLTGYRSLAEVHQNAVDSYAGPTGQVLVNALFPRQPSHMVPVL